MSVKLLLLADLQRHNVRSVQTGVIFSDWTLVTRSLVAVEPPGLL